MDDTDLFTVAQVRAFDRAAIEARGIAGYTLMQRAAAFAWSRLRLRWPQARRIVVICGSGNNGGDGYVLARLARTEGLDAEVVALAEPRAGSDAARAYADWAAVGGATAPADASIAPADVYVDAIFGTGLARPPDGAARAWIERLDAARNGVLALDVPSGVDADSGDVPGVAVRATETASFVAHKRGLFTGAALEYRGALSLDALEIPAPVFDAARPDARSLSAQDVEKRLPQRSKNAHKGNFGHVLAVGGDHGFGGAIRLAGEAALRCGAGLVSIATRAEHVVALNAARPELMAHGVEGAQELEGLLDRASVVALGPGLGQRAWGHALWYAALASGKPSVIDADGLNLLARDRPALPAHSVLTPHPGEAARLLEVDAAAIARDRYGAARAIAARNGAVCVLKGAGTLIATPEGEVAVCPWGNPGMASGGMGDLLTGVIAALLAQGLGAWDAACVGVALHARAGDLAARAGQAGMIASDLFVPLQRLRNAVGADDAG